jgi:gliding motility-associated-like protein
MKNILLIFVGFSLCFNIHSQNASNYWFFGQNAGIIFDNGVPNIQNNSSINTWEGTSSIAINDSVFFYSDGIYLYNKNHNKLNIQLLNSNRSSTQGSIMLMHPDNDSIIFMITNSVTGFNSCPSYYYEFKIINDTNLTLIKEEMLNEFGTEKMSAINHHNGRDIWIVSHSYYGNEYYTYLINKNGISKCKTSSYIGTNHGTLKYPSQGQIKFSISGKYVVSSIIGTIGFDLFKFNNQNGKLYDSIHINNIYMSYGSEFSSEENFLYITTQVSGGNLYQYSLKNWHIDSILKSEKLITNKGIKKISALQLAPNGKIYWSMNDSLYLSAIEEPNKSGDSCNLNFRSLYLNGKKCAYGLPTFNQSEFYTPSINYSYEMNCTKSSIQFWGKDTFGASSHTWHSRKQYGVNSYSLIGSTKDINYTFADTGTYEVRYIASNGTRSDTVTKSITLYDKIKPNFLGNDTIFVRQHQLNAPFSSRCATWYFGSQDSTVGGGNTFIAQTLGTYICQITNQAFCQATDTIVLSNCFDSLPKKLFSSIDSIQCFNQQQFAVKNNIKPQNNNQYSWYLNNVLVSNNFQIDSFKTNSFGQFNLKLTLKNNHPVCKDSFVKKFEVKPNPIANFTINQTTQCADNQKFDFTNNSIFPNKKKQIIWQLENQIIDTFQLLNYQFANTGNYTIKLIVTDSNSCSNEYFDSVRVINKPPSSSFLNQAVFCFTNQNILAKTNKLFNDSITWILNNNITQKNSNDSLLLNNLAANNYQLIINKSNAERCFYTDTLHFEVLPKPTINFTINKDTQCLKNNLFVFNSNSLASNDSIFIYQYAIDNQTFNTKETNYSFANSGNFNIKHSIETKNGCKDSVFKTIFVADIPYPQISADSVCIGEKISLNTNPKTNINSWLWILSNGDVVSKAPPVEHFISQIGTYHVKLVVKNTFNCTDTIEKQNAYTVFPLPNAQFKIFYKPINNNAYSLNFNPEIIKNNYQYTWTLPNGEQIDQDSFNRIFNEKTQGKFSLKTTNEHGCINQSDSVFYFDLSEFKVFIPNAFTPNGDAINPEFKPVNISKNLKNYTLEIFDPWGGKIFESNNPNIGWNGQYKGETVAQGVYVYVIKTISNSDDKTIYKGILLVM